MTDPEWLEAHPLAPYWRTFVFSMGMVLFGVMLLIAFTYKSDTLHQKNQLVQFYRQVDILIEKILLRIKNGEAYHLTKEGDNWKFYFNENESSRTSLTASHQIILDYHTSSQSLVIQRLRNGDLQEVQKVFENLTQCSMELNPEWGAITLSFLEPHTKTPISFQRIFSLGRPR